jgi:hypothetical protein
VVSIQRRLHTTASGMHVCLRADAYCTYLEQCVCETGFFLQEALGFHWVGFDVRFHFPQDVIQLRIRQLIQRPIHVLATHA